jgi:1-acyl-sn-glycerol-3-phosphate acyltransferase
MKDPGFYVYFARPIIKFLMKLVYHPTYIGLENIPDSGRIVLAGNHTNNVDCWLLISSTKRCIHFLAKDSLNKGWKGYLFRGMGIIPVDRTIHDKGALMAAINGLKEEKCIGIFPEGTINRTNDTVMPFKIGAVKMAHDTDTYIVPFTIKGKYKPFKNDLTIEFLTPFKPTDDNLDLENQRLSTIIRDNLERKRSKK